MKKAITILILPVVIALVCSTNYLYAIPAKPTPITMSLPDGSTLTVRLFGDEFSHYYTSADHYLLVYDKNGYFYYAETNAENALQCSSYKAKDVDKRTVVEKAFLASIDKNELFSLQQEQEMQKERKLARRQVVQKATYPTTGKQKAIVILVEYADKEFTISNPREAFSDMLNQENYSDNEGTGSARDYFIASSNGQFQPDFDVYGPVKLAHDMSYYGGNDIRGNDKAPEMMVIEACLLLDNEIDFTQYDRDDDGQIDNVYIFYAGYGEASGGSANTVWPHSWDIYEGTGRNITLDDVKLNHYACSNELEPGNKMDGIGTFCHEFSHVLGLPDLYATSYSGAFTPGEWSLMDGGSYNNNSRTPPYYSVYERYALEWLIPLEIGEPADVKIENIAKNVGYIIKTNQENEYFLLENRQQTSWDAHIPGHGMLIWHIDYNSSVWYRNVVNNTPSHQYVDIEEADGTQKGFSRAGDSFPGQSKITSFTDETSPNMKTWRGVKLNKPITDIEERNGIIYFKISGGRVQIPSVNALPATDITPISFIANWEKSDIATEYKIDVYTLTRSETGKIIVNYADGYNAKNVGNTLSAYIEGIKPATQYRYVVRVSDGTGESTSSNEISVATREPTFEYLAPKVLEATTVTASSFEARWDALDEAQAYLLEVYQKELGDPYSSTINFTGGISQLPAGWKTNCNSTYGSAEYSGNSVPSIRFSKDLNYIESPVFESDIREFSFWYRGADATEANLIILNGYVNKKWIGLDTITAISNAEGGTVLRWKENTENALPEGCKALRITYKMTTIGSLAVDDLVLVYGGDVSVTHLPQYENKSVGNTLSWIVDGLAKANVYYYKVKAFNGDVYSKVSDEMKVRTSSDGVGIEQAQHNESRIRIYRQDSGLFIVSEEPDDISVYIMNMQGNILVRKNISSGEHSFPITEKGMYLVRIGAKVYKMML